MDWAEQVLAGDRRAISRLLTLVENDTPEGQAALEALFPHTGRAHLVGMTGAPGTGKSSLVNRLARYLRAGNDGPKQRVAIVAVDPTSPFTGGAILGDRIRMRELAGDPGVFIRSMASRGALGGLARTTAGLVQVFDAAGFDIIFVETVGAGQTEVEVARLAHTTVVVDAPGLGDDIQAIKAGLLEVADILVVNKYDRPGAEQTVRALRSMLRLAHPAPRLFRETGLSGAPRSEVEGGQIPDSANAGAEYPVWVPPVIQTIATEGEGVSELAEQIARHQRFLEETDQLQQRVRVRLQAELDTRLQEALVARWRETITAEAYGAVLERLLARQISPAQAVAALLDESAGG